MTRGSISWLETHIFMSGAKTCLEWGSGSSTAWFLKHGLSVTSIEHHRGWAEEVNRQLPKCWKRNWDCRVTPPSRSGKMIGSDRCSYFDDYVLEVDKLGKFDIVVVDGRCRSECIRTGVAHVAPGGIFIIDNAERRKYHRSIAENVPEAWERLDFPTEVDLTSVWLTN